jgi:protease-4
VYDYRISKAFGNRNFSFGLGYGFVGGDKSAIGRSNSAQWGFIYRPASFLSIGGGQTWALDNANTQTNIEMAIRPFGNEIVTLFGDLAANANTAGFDYYFEDLISYSAGIVLEPIDGVRLSGRYMNMQQIESINFGLDISYGLTGLSFVGNSPNETGGPESLTAMYRMGAKDRTIFDEVNPIKYYVKINLAGGLKYQSNKFFDNSKTLLNTLRSMDEIALNDAVKGVIINAVGFRANPSMRWELREKIKEIKRSGKKVYIFLERADLDDYHFASVADKIILDEMGSLSMVGYNFGRSFYKNLLDKYDIGFNQIRLFKYKSAVESFAREDYSEGNREQLQALVDSWYKTTLREISESRGDIERDYLDSLINNKLFMNSKFALENDLVDGLGRWHDLESAMEQFDEDFDYAVDFGFIADKPIPTDDKWGYTSKNIAVIYVDGVCAMESGINARKLVTYVKDVIESPYIKAVVLRVDSPGGDALASEYIADVVRQNKGKKPIIVSQGMLAASGGYWLSMDADEILASPYTITGSIGVIAGFLYDKGAGDRLGITTDYVKKGKYADLGFGWQDPILGLGLPSRNLNADEQAQFENNIRDLYADFVNHVADGRGMDSADVHEVAQGRVWSGIDGKDKKLVDKIGGLDEAIELAIKQAGIRENKENVTIYEYPARKAFDFSGLFGQMVGVETDKVSERIETLQWLLKNNGTAMPIVPLEYLEYDIEQ